MTTYSSDAAQRGMHEAVVKKQPLPDDAITAELVAAAQAYDHDHRNDGYNRPEWWTRVPDEQVARLLTGVLPGLTAAITAQAAAAEREAIIARLRRLDILWGRRGWLANAADLIELHPDHGLLGGTADGAHTPGGAT